MLGTPLSPVRQRRRLVLRLLIASVAATVTLTACGSSDDQASEADNASPRVTEPESPPEPLYSAPSEADAPQVLDPKIYEMDPVSLEKAFDAYTKALDSTSDAIDVVPYDTLETSIPAACQGLANGGGAMAFAGLAQSNGIEQGEALGVAALALQSLCPEVDSVVGATFPGGKTSAEFLYGT